MQWFDLKEAKQDKTILSQEFPDTFSWMIISSKYLGLIFLAVLIACFELFLVSFLCTTGFSTPASLVVTCRRLLDMKLCIHLALPFIKVGSAFLPLINTVDLTLLLIWLVLLLTVSNKVWCCYIASYKKECCYITIFTDGSCYIAVLKVDVVTLPLVKINTATLPFMKMGTVTLPFY